jgi:hypothetical protein
MANPRKAVQKRLRTLRTLKNTLWGWMPVYTEPTLGWKVSTQSRLLMSRSVNLYWGSLVLNGGKS